MGKGRQWEKQKNELPCTLFSTSKPDGKETEKKAENQCNGSPSLDNGPDRRGEWGKLINHCGKQSETARSCWEQDR
ncbi:MAG: hypothetical protein NVS4B11_31840 [Ktedonobacteraceae bacterium]